MIPCLQLPISVSIPPAPDGEVLFLQVSSLAVSGTFSADGYFHLPYSLYKISGNVFLICSLEIPLLLLGKISGRLLPGSSVHSLMQENLLLSAIDVLFYIRPVYFSASFFLSGND